MNFTSCRCWNRRHTISPCTYRLVPLVDSNYRIVGRVAAPIWVFAWWCVVQGPACQRAVACSGSRSAHQFRFSMSTYTVITSILIHSANQRVAVPNDLSRSLLYIPLVIQISTMTTSRQMNVIDLFISWSFSLPLIKVSQFYYMVKFKTTCVGD